MENFAPVVPRYPLCFKGYDGTIGCASTNERTPCVSPFLPALVQEEVAVHHGRCRHHRPVDHLRMGRRRRQHRGSRPTERGLAQRVLPQRVEHLWRHATVLVGALRRRAADHLPTATGREDRRQGSLQRRSRGDEPSDSATAQDGRHHHGVRSRDPLIRRHLERQQVRGRTLHRQQQRGVRGRGHQQRPQRAP